jgi:hypothetical protein
MGDVMDDRREAISAVIREYDGQGWHRTGTEVDAASGQWLADRVARLGARPAFEPFTLDRIDLLPSYVEIDGRREDATPTFDNPLTEADGVVGRLGPLGSDAPIALVPTPPGPERFGDLYATRRANRHRAIVAPTMGGIPGLALVNAPDFREPYGPPVLQVSGTLEPWLAEAASRGATVRVVAAGKRQPAEARNVVAAVPGRDPSLAPLLVVTPRSGWWACASERACGIAIWLEVLRAATAGLDRTVQFVASSGHELGHLGLKSFLDVAHPTLAREAFATLHLGANIGATGSVLNPTASDASLQAATEAALQASGAPMAVIVVTEEAHTRGESKEVFTRGGRFVSFVGTNPQFHLPTDRWPDAVDMDDVTAYAAAAVRLVEALGRAD